MKSVSKFFLFLFAVMAMVSCEKINGEGPVVTEQRAISNFSEIAIAIPGKVFYKQDSVYKVELQAQQNVLDVVQTRLNGNELLLKLENGKVLRHHQQIIVVISSPQINRVALSGAADVTVANTIHAPALKINVSGSGNLSFNNVVVAGRLTAQLDGSGNINIQSGTAKDEQFSISGSGNINGGDVLAETGISSISGSGNIYINASKELMATISGSGSVYYRGNPRVSAHVSGSGRVRPY